MPSHVIQKTYYAQLSRPFTASQPISGRDQNRILDNFQADNPTVRSVFWINPSGLIVASSLRSYIGFDVSDRSFVKEIIGGRNWTVSELILGRATGKLAFTISRGVRDEQGKLLGIVAAAIEPDRMDSVLGLVRSSGAAVSLIDNKGMQVYRRPDLGYTMEQRNLLKNYPIIEGSLKGQNVLALITSASTGERRLVAYTPVPTVGWVASAGRSEDEAMKPVMATLRLQFGLLLLVVLLSFGAALFLSNPTLKAITQLRNRALAFRHRPTEGFAITSGPDEIKDLSLALNQMADEVQLREKQLIDANNDAQQFIKKLNEIEDTDKYRLPTEAEWEYACRAGTMTKYSFGDDASKLVEYACYFDDSKFIDNSKVIDVSRMIPRQVTSGKPNPFGLYEMHGNVSEWVEDDWRKKPSREPRIKVEPGLIIPEHPIG